jgi:hypothetical protein
MKKTGMLSLTVLCVFVTGCADQREPMDSPSPADLQRLCPAGTTLVCFERLHKPVRCFCSDRSTVEEMLEPRAD